MMSREAICLKCDMKFTRDDMQGYGARPSTMSLPELCPYCMRREYFCCSFCDIVLNNMRYTAPTGVPCCERCCKNAWSLLSRLDAIWSAEANGVSVNEFLRWL